MTHQQSMNRREWAMLLALAVLWGGSFFFIKVMVEQMAPFSVVLGRVGVAAVLINLWLALKGEVMRFSGRQWGAFALMGLLNNVLPFSLIAFGESHISSGLASILNATTPLYTVLVAHCFTVSEKITAAKVAGIATGFVGVAVLVGVDSVNGLARGSIVGEAACLLAALTYAFAGVYGRRFKAIAPIKVATGQITTSALMLIPLVALVDQPWTRPLPGLPVWAAMAGLAFFCTVVAYILYFRLLATAGATNLLLVTFLIPVSAILLGSMVLGEVLLPQHLMGMLLIGCGLALIDGRVLRGCSRRRT